MDNISPQEQEALSARYTQYAIVAALEDGSFAVFANDLTRESMIIVSDPDDLALACASRIQMCKRITPSIEDRERSKAIPSLAGMFDTHKEQ